MASGREAAGWGSVGALSFLVLALGFSSRQTPQSVSPSASRSVGVVASLASRRVGRWFE